MGTVSFLSLSLTLSLSVAVFNCKPAFAKEISSMDRGLILKRALEVAPETSAAKAEIAAVRAKILDARLFPEEELELEIEEFGLDSPGISKSEFSLAWFRNLEPKSRRNLRIELSRSKGAASKEAQARSLLNFLYEVSRAYYEVLAKEAAMELAKRKEHLASELHRVASKRVEVGAAAGLEEERASIELEAARVETKRAKRSFESAREVLASFLNWPASKLQRLEGNVDGQTPLPSLQDSLERMSKEHPLLSLLKERRDGAQASLELAKNRSRGNLRSIFGVRHFSANAETTLFMGLSLPLKQQRRGRAAKERHRARIEKLAYERTTVVRKLKRRIEKAVSDASAAREELQAIEGRILPRAELVFSSVKKAYLRGELSYSDLLSAERELVEAEHRRLAVLDELRASLLALEYHSGGSSMMDSLIEEALQ